MRIHVSVADRAPIVRKGLEAVLKSQSGFTFLSADDTGAHVIRSIRRYRPDVIVLDHDIAKADGFQIMATISRKGFSTRILVYAMTWSNQDVHDVVASGAAGFIGKQDPVEELLRAIRALAGGKMAFSDAALRALQSHLQNAGDTEGSLARDSGRPLITDRELMVLQALAKGISIASTGRILHMSPSTVRNHRQSVFSKLGVANAPAAVYEAMHRGLIT